jgi:hypothetical protein
VVVVENQVFIPVPEVFRLRSAKEDTGAKK